jgi:hypothetical protein
MLSGANAFEISDIERLTIGAHQPGDCHVAMSHALWLHETTIRQGQVEPSLQRHKETFGRAPEFYGSDRGFFSETNLKSCKRDGVKVVCIPQRGGKKTAKRETYEKSPAFKEGQRFQAGIEGRISVLFRGRGMKRCLAEGHQRFELLVGAAVLANNLMRIAALLSKRTRRKRKAAKQRSTTVPLFSFRVDCMSSSPLS